MISKRLRQTAFAILVSILDAIAYTIVAGLIVFDAVQAIARNVRSYFASTARRDADL